MILGDVEEVITTVEIDDETYEEIIKVRAKLLHNSSHKTFFNRKCPTFLQKLFWQNLGFLCSVSRETRESPRVCLTPHTLTLNRRDSH